jgi:enolase
VVNGVFDAIGGMDAEAQVKIDETLIALDGTANKARQANSILECLAVPRLLPPLRLPLYRYLGGTSARLLRLDDEYNQRRGTRGQSDRFPGVHDHADRRHELAEALRIGSDLSPLRAALKAQGTPVGDR